VIVFHHIPAVDSIAVVEYTSASDSHMCMSTPELSDQHLGGPLEDPGDAHQQLALARERFDLVLDLV
jgi:hypothetical protein